MSGLTLYSLYYGLFIRTFQGTVSRSRSHEFWGDSRTSTLVGHATSLRALQLFWNCHHVSYIWQHIYIGTLWMDGLSRWPVWVKRIIMRVMECTLRQSYLAFLRFIRVSGEWWGMDLLTIRPIRPNWEDYEWYNERFTFLDTLFASPQ